MTKKIIQVEIYESPIKERNNEKFGHGQEYCECCGKRMKEGGTTYWFHASTSWLALPNDVEEEELQAAGIESQGAFQIGPECSKKFPKGYIKIQKKDQ